MSKKIVILNGSPRKNGNTSALTAAFAKGGGGGREHRYRVSPGVYEDQRLPGLLARRQRP